MIPRPCCPAELIGAMCTGTVVGDVAAIQLDAASLGVLKSAKSAKSTPGFPTNEFCRCVKFFKLFGILWRHK